MMKWDRSHYWIDYTYKRKGKHQAIIVHAADVRDTVNDLVEEACEELGTKLPENWSWNSDQTWLTVGKFLNTIKIEISEAHTETEMIEMGLIDDPSEIQLSEKWTTMWDVELPIETI